MSGARGAHVRGKRPRNPPGSCAKLGKLGRDADGLMVLGDRSWRLGSQGTPSRDDRLKEEEKQTSLSKIKVICPQSICQNKIEHFHEENNIIQGSYSFIGSDGQCLMVTRSV